MYIKIEPDINSAEDFNLEARICTPICNCWLGSFKKIAHMKTKLSQEHFNQEFYKLHMRMFNFNHLNKGFFFNTIEENSFAYQSDYQFESDSLIWTFHIEIY